MGMYFYNIRDSAKEYCLRVHDTTLSKFTAYDVHCLFTFDEYIISANNLLAD